MHTVSDQAAWSTLHEQQRQELEQQLQRPTEGQQRGKLSI